MIVTIEAQMALLEKYDWNNDKSIDEVLAFQDGINATLELVDKILKEKEDSHRQ